MGLGDLYQAENEKAWDAIQALPVTTKPPAEPPRWRGWSAPLRGIAAGAAEAAAAAADSIKGAAQVFAATPMGGPDPYPEQTEAARKRMVEDGIDTNSNVGRSLRNAARDYRPDPGTAGVAETLFFEIPRVVGKAVGYGVAAGPVGAAVGLTVDEGMTVASDLGEKGVDLGTRAKVGAVAGAAAGVGVALPMAGSTVTKTAALVVAGGPGGFVAQQVASREILKRADYETLATQYDPLDPVGLALATILPVGFGAYALRSARRAARPAAAPVADAAPPAAAPEAPVAPDAPVEAVQALTGEQVDAVMTHNLTLQADALDAARPTEQSAGVPRAAELGSVDRAIEGRLAARVTEDFEGAVAEYAARPDSDGGKILNTDIARELSPEYLADRTRSAAVHEPASYFVKRLYEEKLAQIKPGDDVMFTSGGTGAGKTTAIELVPGLRQLSREAAIVYDTNMNSLASAVKKVEQALAAGGDVTIVHVQRDPVDALLNGALPRAMRQAQQYGTGRTVPLIEHARTHRGAAEVVQQLAAKYADNPRVTVSVVDNTQGRGGARVSDLGFVKGFDYTDIEGKLYEALKQARDSGAISGDVFRATEGTFEAGTRASDRRVVRPEPESGDAPASPAGQAARAELSDTPGAPRAGDSPTSPSQDPVTRSIAERITTDDAVGNMVVRTTEDGTPVTARDELERIRREAAEGTDDELGSNEAGLIQVAAECALRLGQG